MDKQTRELIARERELQRQLMVYYGHAIGAVQRELVVVLADIEAARAQGRVPTERWLRKQASYERWLQLTRLELARYVLAADPAITDLQRGHIGQALTDSRDQIAENLGAAPPLTVAAVTAEFRVPHADVIRTLVGRASDGTPLADLLDHAAGAAHEQAKRALIEGVIRGHNPRKIARDLAARTQIGLHRSLLIARTESIGAYRDTAIATYRANDHVVQEWVWTASLDRRTCASCWAMHGSVHALDETLDSHPGCRCAPVPRTKSWADLGISLPDTRPRIVTGTERFAALPAEDQLAILGPGKHAAYKAGDIALTDLVQVTHSHRWGTGRREASLEHALATH